MAWINPKTDWVDNPKNPKSEDFNRIEGNIEFLKEEIETKKGVIVDALNTVGVATSINDTHVQIANKITGAEKKNILLTPGVSDVLIPKGIYNTNGGKVKGDTNLIASNILQGKSIFGVIGTAINGAGMKKYALGTRSGGVSSISVTGLGFRPSMVFVYTDIFGNNIRWHSIGIGTPNGYPYNQGIEFSRSGSTLDSFRAVSFSPSSGGFTIGIYSGGSSYSPTIYWYAVE